MNGRAYAQLPPSGRGHAMVNHDPRHPEFARDDGRDGVREVVIGMFSVPLPKKSHRAGRCRRDRRRRGGRRIQKRTAPFLRHVVHEQGVIELRLQIEG